MKAKPQEMLLKKSSPEEPGNKTGTIPCRGMHVNGRQPTGWFLPGGGDTNSWRGVTEPGITFLMKRQAAAKKRDAATPPTAGALNPS